MWINEIKQKHTKNKVTRYSNWPRVLLFDLAHKQCNDIIRGWLHCLTSESKERFLASNILLAWCLVIAQIQFSLTKKIFWTSKILTNPHLLRLITSRFHLPPPPPPNRFNPPPPQNGRHMCITPKELLLLGPYFVQSCVLPEAGARQKNVFSLISHLNTCVGVFFFW